MKPINELVQKVQNQTIARKALNEMQAGLEFIYMSINTMDAILPDLDSENNYADDTCNYGRGQIEEAIEWLERYIIGYDKPFNRDCNRWQWDASQDVDCDGIEVTK